MRDTEGEEGQPWVEVNAKRFTRDLGRGPDPLVFSEAQVRRFHGACAARRFVFIAGAPGVGKTQLALRYARYQVQRSGGRVLYLFACTFSRYYH